MSSASSRRALSLYRRICRTAREWTGPAEEKQYIYSEARAQFVAKRGLTAVDEIEAALNEGHAQLEIGLHYGIAYPRLHHAPLTGGGDMKAVGTPLVGEEGGEASAASIVETAGAAPGAARLRTAFNAPLNPTALKAKEKARQRRAKLKAAHTIPVMPED